MARKPAGLLDRMLYDRVLSHWTKTASKAAETDLETLRTQRQSAQSLRAKLEEIIHLANCRLALPRAGSNAFPRPAGTQWSWRPGLWRGPLQRKGQASVASTTKFGNDVTVFHDCNHNEITLRQLRSHRETDLAPFVLKMDVLNFEGSFLSCATDLPADAAAGLSRRHIIRMNMTLELEKPIDVFARLNIKHGPNTEKITAEVPPDALDAEIEFDLAYADINENRVERIWVDLIFGNPAMNQITLRDVTFHRYPRAAL